LVSLEAAIKKLDKGQYRSVKAEPNETQNKLRFRAFGFATLRKN
jgi:hypothetical protein